MSHEVVGYSSGQKITFPVFRRNTGPGEGSRGSSRRIFGPPVGTYGRSVSPFESSEGSFGMLESTVRESVELFG